MRKSRRAMAAVAVVVVLVLTQLVLIGAVTGGAREDALTLDRLDTVRAFYAAEAGMNMAVRELMRASDEDGDGVIGTISNDGISANDPSLGPAQVVVTAVEVAGVTTLTSEGRSGRAVRRIEAELE